MKAIPATLSLTAFALAFNVYAHPSALSRQATTFPSSTKKGLSYNTASYTVGAASFRLYIVKLIATIQNAFNLEWVYNWGETINADTGTAADTGSLNAGVEFTPMLCVLYLVRLLIQLT